MSNVEYNANASYKGSLTRSKLYSLAYFHSYKINVFFALKGSKFSILICYILSCVGFEMTSLTVHKLTGWSYVICI